MNAREVIEGAIRSCIRKEHLKRPWGDVVVSDLSAAGFTIMSKKDVEAVRDEALEEYKAVLDKVNHATDREIEAAAIRAKKEAGV